MVEVAEIGWSVTYGRVLRHESICSVYKSDNQPRCERSQRSRVTSCSLILYSKVPRPEERLSSNRHVVKEFLGGTSQHRPIFQFDLSTKVASFEFAIDGSHAQDRPFFELTKRVCAVGSETDGKH